MCAYPLFCPPSLFFSTRRPDLPLLFPPHPLPGFTVLAFASSFTSTLRSTFLAAVEPAQASKSPLPFFRVGLPPLRLTLLPLALSGESMAAFSILNDISSILSSIVMGALFAWFTNAGRSELLFVVTSVSLPNTFFLSHAIPLRS